MRTSDFNAEEEGFKNQIESTLREVRATAGACPDPDLLMAARSGILTQSAEAVQHHILICPICSQLSKDLSEHEYPGASDDEDKRMRARWRGLDQPARRSIWRPLAAVAAAVLLAAGGLGMWLARRSVQQQTAEVVPPPVQIPSGSLNTSRFVLPFEKAPIKIPAAAVLLYRSDAGSSQAFLNDLAAALKPYRADDYAEASRRLENLSRKYPNSPEAHFYLGVSQLFLNDNTHAVDSLQAARRLTDESSRDSISWYLIVALDRDGRYWQARTEASSLCAQAGEYKQKACAAAAEMKRP